MNLADLEDAKALDAAVADAIAVLSQGLPGQPSQAKPTPSSSEPRASERLKDLLRRAREVQAAIVARAFIRGFLAADADFYEPRARTPYEIGRQAAIELVEQLERTGRALEGRSEIGRVGSSDKALLELLTALAAVHDENRESRTRLRAVLAKEGTTGHLGVFLAGFVHLVPFAAEAGEGLEYAAEELVPELLPEVERALEDESGAISERSAAHTAMPPADLIGHTLRAGARRLAFLSGQRTRS